MSGGWVPYHLRWNKAIDRSIFMEFLIKLNAFRNLDSYSYIGFGAIHMEDFKLVHSLFSISDLTCIEQDLIIHNRQKFNRPLGCLKFENITSGDFITEFFPEKNSIIWLDYANPRQIGDQIREFQSILPKMSRYDVIKVTLNANPNSLADVNNPQLKGNQLFDQRLQVLQQRLSGNLPSTVTSEFMNIKRLPVALCHVLEFASKRALGRHSNLVYYPVNSFVYADSNHQMLTVTGIMLNSGEEEEFIERAGLNNWEYMYTPWGEPLKIDIPDLTIRERMAIDSWLPCEDPTAIIDQLSILFDEDEEKSLRKLESYIKYYRHYPFFSKVSV
ncbi:O-methyltransferase [Brevibacillus centrosporus]|uniref:O-methyltransferase n=1 Tax=Brevibacillus centrosporus TaxID=54910 RepID=UPI0037F2F484